ALVDADDLALDRHAALQRVAERLERRLRARLREGLRQADLTALEGGDEGVDGVADGGQRAGRRVEHLEEALLLAVDVDDDRAMVHLNDRATHRVAAREATACRGGALLLEEVCERFLRLLRFRHRRAHSTSQAERI